MCHFGERRECRKLLPGTFPPRNEPVDAKGFLVEKHTAAEVEGRIELRVLKFGLALHLDAYVSYQVPGHRTVRGGSGHAHGASGANQGSFLVTELVAAGVAPEVVVVFEDKNPGPGPGCLAVEIGCCQSADSAAYHDQVVNLVGVRLRTHVIPGLAAHQFMGHFPGAVVAAPEPCPCRGVVAGLLLGGKLGMGGSEGLEPGRREQGAGHRHPHAI